MRPVWILALAATGCRSILGIGDPPERPDAAAFAACADWHPAGFDPCALTVNAASLSLAAAAYIYDTSDVSAAGGTLYDAAHAVVVRSEQTIMQTDGSTVAVLAVGELTTSIATSLAVIGPHPLLLVSGSSITINGAIDASSHLGIADAAAHLVQMTRIGAGADQGCLVNAGRDGGDAAAGGSGGGGGGGLRGAGGAGGGGGAGSTSVRGGALGPAGELAVIRGGCPGGASGAAGSIAHPPAKPGYRALGGAGGGALRLAARDRIDVAGTITANGAGGGGAPTNSSCGGGGGGAGGYLGFDAPTVELRGIITANAGGGGSGGTSSETGNDGADGSPSASAAAGGANASPCAGAGGAGAAGASADGTTAVTAICNDSGGGGGGGASGIIVVRSTLFTAGTATVSPAPTMQ